jgi:hypothetical protein
MGWGDLAVHTGRVRADEGWPNPEFDRDGIGGGCGRNGDEKEGESTETGVGFEYKWSRLAPELAAVPDGEEMEPMPDIGSEGGSAPDWSVGATTTLDRIVHRSHKGASARKNLSCKRELPNQRLEFAATEEGGSVGSSELGLEFVHPSCWTGDCCCDRIEFDAEEIEALGWPLGLRWIHREAELDEDGRCASHHLFDVSGGWADKEEIIEVANENASRRRESVGDDTEEFSANSRGGGKTEWHSTELIKSLIESEHEVWPGGRVKREGEEAIGEIHLAEPTTGVTDCDRIIDGRIAEVFVTEGGVEVARQIDNESRFPPFLHDHMKWLRSCCQRRIRRQLNHSTEFHIFE